MSLNKGSLDKANHNQKLDIEYLYTDFIAGENITANQAVMIDVTATEEVLIATQSIKHLVCGVALNDALITETVKVCIYGIVDVVAATNIVAGDILGIGITAGRVTKRTTRDSGGGSAHTHAESLLTGNPSATVNTIERVSEAADDYCATTSGGSPTRQFWANMFNTVLAVASSTHNHLVTGSIDNESAHLHSFYQAQVLGKALQTFTTGNTGKMLVCLA